VFLGQTLKGESAMSYTQVTRTMHMIWYLVKRDFQLRYAGSVLGFFWSLVVPLSQLLLLVFVFSKVIPLNIVNFPVFVFIGLLPWNWFSSSLLASGGIFTAARDLLYHPNIHPGILVLVTVLANLMTLLLSLPVLFGMLYWYDLDFPWLFLPAFPLLILVQTPLTVGLSFMIATANVFYRDVSQLIGIVVMLLFFVTPIWYAVPQNSSYAYLFEINPMSLIVQNYRLVLLDGRWLDWPSLMMASGMSIGMLAVGYFVHRHFQSDVIDAI
jgi:lipopolysaccharide transport system permease protein